MGGGYQTALRNLRRRAIRVYGTFIFGYDQDTEETFKSIVDFAIENKFYLAAFNHLTPFPGTPLYSRLKDSGRLRYDAWWLDEHYSYNTLPFRPNGLPPEEISRLCVEARQRFFSWNSMFRRGFDAVNWTDMFMLRAFFTINLMHRREVMKRNKLPFGDPDWNGTLLKAA
jgi:radical SAM superfamily enzyme YgiQ (UPF0313 family)